MPKKDDASVEEFDAPEDDAVETQDDLLEDESDDDQTDDTDSADDDETSDDDTSDEDDDDGADDDETDDDDSEVEFEKKYSHLKGDTPGEYAKSLEDAYTNSSKEAQKLARKNKELEDQLKALKGDSDDKGADKEVDPAIAYARAEMTRQMDEDWDTWVESHPEVTTDPALREQVIQELSVQAEAYLQKTGQQIRMRDALKRTAAILGLDNNSEEKTVSAVKGQAATSKRGAAPKKKSQTSDVSEKAVKIGEMMGLTKEDIVKYNKK